ncbi:protein RESPONSE TO ABA AND SALT 1-like [Primulina huaijiensis]|uniref:protein RESPONSE TO ABA AND SALT 1-like n=1 Tax=Primulina huaijiensis TaxID=1492673 RepID=UPI003CC7801D
MSLPTRSLESSNSLDAQSFELFFQHWLINQERYLQQLVQIIECGNDEENDIRCNGLIQEVMAHLNQYYEAKERVARENVFLVFTPTWFSSFERTYLWLGGFRPGLAIRIVSNNVLDLTGNQSEMINALMTRVKEEEKELTEELATVQAGLVSPSLVELARTTGRPRNGEEANADSAIEHLAASMEDLLQCANFLRKKTIVKLVETLKPAQTIRFLAAAINLQLRIRSWGMQRDAPNHLV